MPQSFRATALVPRGFVVDEVTSDGASALITVRSVQTASVCPGCGTQSGRVHSRYHRCLADLPIAGRPVRLRVRARRFYCRTVLCGRRVFAERFDDDVLVPRPRGFDCLILGWIEAWQVFTICKNGDASRHAGFA
ncbi:transposase family protein [Acidisoma cladoniae]|uniref:transposase family protein n=1 Tax=Acidisoma cladoniae TaxID=3040935 RepID=UPI003D9C9DC2